MIQVTTRWGVDRELRTDAFHWRFPVDACRHDDNSRWA